MTLPASLDPWNKAVPRYTSYPTAPQFVPLFPSCYQAKLHHFAQTTKPLSLYLHIPFCRSMCLFCACSVILNRDGEKQRRYVEHLLREIELLHDCFKTRRLVTQLHLGGGTPTSLTEEEFTLLMDKLHANFLFSPAAELSIEIDPRTVFADGGKKLTFLRKIGFNRVSFGVQDFDPHVQEAVKRRQSREMTLQTYTWARELGFEGINMDFIYGLPHQSAAQFSQTVEQVIALKPDRIAFFSYAKVPWLKAHQKAIDDAWLPSTEEKWKIYVESREKFLENGYVGIGMDHFALATDPLATALQEKKLMRNFQGYSLKLAEDLIGLGVTSIGFLAGSYFQNKKKLDEYEKMIENGELPVERGLILSEEDLRRRWVIESLMCHFEVDKEEFHKQFGKEFDRHFSKEIEQLEKEGWLAENGEQLVPTQLGKLLIRIVASTFDAYLSRGQFSKAI